TMSTELSERFDTKLQTMSAELSERFDTKLQTMSTKLSERFDTKLQTMHTELSNTIEQKLIPIKNDITNIKVHLENVIIKNIKIVAEGHLDLTRKLDEALKIENEKEILLIRMTYLEDEIREIKQRLTQIA
ncbi:MAG: hypothetical protein OSJ62_17810, partial [Lachnospiraceae bacterium]|nr:hypothetical protein [Lachnospiraceae bacterium]